jgi:hypothetical protein
MGGGATALWVVAHAVAKAAMKAAESADCERSERSFMVP